ncbi:putative mucin TcMUCII [Trypanosoma cruzi]|uniref:Mucin TcMUCII, putative n=2 Tax=Trypanosoma cruzi TaxID=5693 RepID=Q4D389_TRYCC|nr:mucin TcMUCII, putative [Trypanosoma cruzi]EAN86987.1 mucin TcMUCII, putative [Trypanosoma cruzi]KAF8288553.1 putative mucin TcMUCII [Trypanosoma cruzi]PWU98888.1 putative mucin TcMUCII [Trypanosoma cruzi]|eukprot:XP_808838.1 mucin TcMUCII [Trypanosoma cruzi strain CL Brener]
MMTTCRLLCALLVLALCCCPSVCVTGSEDKAEKAGQGSTLQDSGGSSNSDNPEAKVTEDNEQSSDKEPNSSERQSKTAAAPATSTSTVTEEGPSGAPTSQDGRDASVRPGASEGNNPSPGPTGDFDKSVVKNPEHNNEVALAGKEVNEQAPTTTTTTTTTTTMAPTTTTTTTAPEAPGDTAMNAEAPTTTTTRTPSRLREVDGGLSSSALVCSPLLLAVSALAYTAVG